MGYAAPIFLPFSILDSFGSPSNWTVPIHEWIEATDSEGQNRSKLADLPFIVVVRFETPEMRIER